MTSLATIIRRAMAGGVPDSARYEAELDDAVRTGQITTDKIIETAERSKASNRSVEVVTERIRTKNRTRADPIVALLDGMRSR